MMISIPDQHTAAVSRDKQTLVRRLFSLIDWPRIGA